MMSSGKRFVEVIDKNNQIVYIKSREDDRYDAWKKKVHPTNKFLSKLELYFRNVFLPDGYPDSVSSDYMDYQIWDTVQAFASSITGSLATLAVLEGVGVGDKNATPLAAAITWILKDGVGHIGKILFAWSKGTDLDSNCKQWRLFADILNDAAICLDLVIVMFPSFLRTAVLCVSNLARSVVGVAGGATRAALTQHQARSNNMADVSAKDGSQETLVNLMALIINLVLLPLVTDAPWKIWSLFLCFTLIHLYSNYRAVRSLALDTFNTARLNIVIRRYLADGVILGVKETNLRESVLPNFNESYKIRFGSSMETFVKASSDYMVETAFQHLQQENYFVYTNGNEVHVVLSNISDSRSNLKAYINAVTLLLLQESEEKCLRISEDLLNQLNVSGWNLEKNLLTCSGRFIQLPS